MKRETADTILNFIIWIVGVCAGFVIGYLMGHQQGVRDEAKAQATVTVKENK